MPPFLAFYFGFLYLQTTLEDNNNIVDREKKLGWFDIERNAILGLTPKFPDLTDEWRVSSST